MYTYNIFCYGHRIADNEEFNEFISENDLVFRETTILGKKSGLSIIDIRLPIVFLSIFLSLPV